MKMLKKSIPIDTPPDKIRELLEEDTPMERSTDMARWNQVFYSNTTLSSVTPTVFSAMQHSVLLSSGWKRVL